MADRDINLTHQERIAILQGNLLSDNTRWKDLLQEKLGTTRKSEVIAKIGDTNIPYDQLIDNWLLTL